MERERKRERETERRRSKYWISLKLILNDASVARLIITVDDVGRTLVERVFTSGRITAALPRFTMDAGRTISAGSTSPSSITRAKCSSFTSSSWKSVVFFFSLSLSLSFFFISFSYFFFLLCDHFPTHPPPGFWSYRSFTVQFHQIITGFGEREWRVLDHSRSQVPFHGSLGHRGTWKIFPSAVICAWQKFTPGCHFPSSWHSSQPVFRFRFRLCFASILSIPTIKSRGLITSHFLSDGKKKGSLIS